MVNKTVSKGKISHKMYAAETKRKEKCVWIRWKNAESIFNKLRIEYELRKVRRWAIDQRANIFNRSQQGQKNSPFVGRLK